ncbi:hypothetical protein BDP27DRAFT_1427351 [Rhodocollybia butyracea]|uniref:Uncharacterized protein n=1 Tax=Rhodocollybia butyracea TaxID=206335 RepID=A0A9P5PD52_9AGAR|nr:hypothetical protein BDP27DRAFT_1427351 [Rhodocollybia butyracea]
MSSAEPAQGIEEGRMIAFTSMVHRLRNIVVDLTSASNENDRGKTVQDALFDARSLVDETSLTLIGIEGSISSINIQIRLLIFLLKVHADFERIGGDEHNLGSLVDDISEKVVGYVDAMSSGNVSPGSAGGSVDPNQGVEVPTLTTEPSSGGEDFPGALLQASDNRDW